MATRSNASVSQDEQFGPERAVDLRYAAPSGRSRQFVNTVNSFAEMVAPRRRIIRDPYYGAMPEQSAPRTAHRVKLTKVEWGMTVIAGITLGTAVAFMFAGI